MCVSPRTWSAPSTRQPMADTRRWPGPGHCHRVRVRPRYTPPASSAAAPAPAADTRLSSRCLTPGTPPHTAIPTSGPRPNTRARPGLWPTPPDTPPTPPSHPQKARPSTLCRTSRARLAQPRCTPWCPTPGRQWSPRPRPIIPHMPHISPGALWWVLASVTARPAPPITGTQSPMTCMPWWPSLPSTRDQGSCSGMRGWGRSRPCRPVRCRASPARRTRARWLTSWTTRAQPATPAPTCSDEQTLSFRRLNSTQNSLSWRFEFDKKICGKALRLKR